MFIVTDNASADGGRLGGVGVVKDKSQSLRRLKPLTYKVERGERRVHLEGSGEGVDATLLSGTP